MTSKFPLCCAMMELAHRLSRQNLALNLQWVPREQNVEADELSNFKDHRFSQDKRVDVESMLGQMAIFQMTYKMGKSLYGDLKEIKEEKKAMASKPEGVRRTITKRKRSGRERSLSSSYRPYTVH